MGTIIERKSRDRKTEEKINITKDCKLSEKIEIKKPKELIRVCSLPEPQIEVKEQNVTGEFTQYFQVDCEAELSKKLKICEDAELFLRILFNTNPEEGKFIPFCVCIHYFHKGLGTGLKNEEKEKIITEPLYILDKHKKNLQRYKILKDFYYRIGFSYLWQGERLKAMKYLFLSLPKYHIKSIIRMLSVLLPNNLRYNLEDYLLKYKIKNLS